MLHKTAWHFSKFQKNVFMHRSTVQILLTQIIYVIIKKKTIENCRWLPKSKRKGRSGGSSCRAALPWLKGSATTASTTMHPNISLCTWCSIFKHFYHLFVYLLSLLEYTSIYLFVLCFFLWSAPQYVFVYFLHSNVSLSIAQNSHNRHNRKWCTCFKLDQLFSIMNAKF